MAERRRDRYHGASRVRPQVVHAAVYTKSYHHSIGTQKTAQIEVRTGSTEFNVYAVEWTPEEIRGYVNQQQFFTFKNERLTNPAADYQQWPFDRPFHLILNIAAGGTWGGLQGDRPEDLASTHGGRLRSSL